MALDKTYLNASDGTGDAALMHVTVARSISSTIIEVDSIVGVPAKFIATSGTPNSTGFIDPATKTDFYGHINGSDLEIDGFLPGNSDTGNAEGQIVVIKPNTGWADLVADLIQAMEETIVKTAYPVGSIYFNVGVSTNPATLLGFGTWVRTSAGQFLVGSSDVDSDFFNGVTGGAKTHSHTVAGHTHEMFHTGTNNGDWFTNGGVQITAGTNVSPSGATRDITPQTGSSTTYSTGSASPATNAVSGLPPYVAVYMWKRTA